MDVGKPCNIRTKLLIKAHIVASVQESTRQLTAAAAVLSKAAGTVPRSVPVDFLRGWCHVFGLMLGPLTAVLLFLWGLGAFSGVAQAQYDRLRQQQQALTRANEQLRTEGRFYLDQVQQYRKKFPKAASHFPKYTAPVAMAPAAE